MHLALTHPRAKQAGGWQAGQQLCRRGPSGPCGQLTKHESAICPCTDEFREKTSFPLQKYKLPSEETEIIKQEYFFHFAGSLLCRLANTKETTHLPSTVYKCSH